MLLCSVCSVLQVWETSFVFSFISGAQAYVQVKRRRCAVTLRMSVKMKRVERGLFRHFDDGTRNPAWIWGVSCQILEQKNQHQFIYVKRREDNERFSKAGSNILQTVKESKTRGRDHGDLSLWIEFLYGFFFFFYDQKLYLRIQITLDISNFGITKTMICRKKKVFFFHLEITQC